MLTAIAGVSEASRFITGKKIEQFRETWRLLNTGLCAKQAINYKNIF